MAITATRIGAVLLGLAILAAGVALWRLDRGVEEGFQKLGEAPSRVYARPLVLHRGLDPVETGVAAHLGRVGYRLVAGPEVGGAEFAVRRDRWIIGVRPFRHARGREAGGRVTAHLDPEGRIAELLDARELRLERVRIDPVEVAVFRGSEARDRIPVRLSEVPAHLVDAVLTTEDRRFFEHGGLDPRRMLSAAYSNLRAGRVVEGASTITQQLARSVYLTRERTLWRKLKESLIALLLELRHEKDAILEAYLNEIYLGQQGAVAIHGVGLAARHYFGKGVGDLALAESALLAGIIRAPSLYSPLHRTEAARERRDLVLSLLRKRGHITEAEHREAAEAPLGLRPSLPEVSSASYFVDLVRQRLALRYGAAALVGEGLAVYTSLDLRLQGLAERILRDRLESIEGRFPILKRRELPLQAALVALEPRTGQLLALVGGRDYRTAPYNRAVSARRQPGSAFKPVVALAALTRPGGEGKHFTLASVLRDVPFRLRVPGGMWRPRNHDGVFRGAVTVREAVEQSLNVPMVRLAEATGLGRVIATARRLGFESPFEPVPSLPLGTFEVSLLEITRAYAVLAAEGSRAPLRAVLGVFDRDRTALAPLEVRPLQVFTPAEIYLVTSALQGAADRGTATFARKLGYHGALAAKTGSTNDFRDSWFVGYTPEVAIGVWAGFDDNRRIGLPGSALALPMAVDLLKGVMGSHGAAHFRPPPGLERVRVSIDKGGVCRSVVEIFLQGTAPTEGCDVEKASARGRRLEPEPSRTRRSIAELDR